MSNPKKQERPQWLNDANQGFVEIDGKKHLAGEAWAADESAERAVLTCLLIAGAASEGRAVMKRIGFLRYNDFFQQRHGLIFRAMEVLTGRGDEIDVLAVTNVLRGIPGNNSGTLLEQVGGDPYLTDLANQVAYNLETHARMVMDKSIRRTYKLIALKAAKLADDHRLSLDELIACGNMVQRDLEMKHDAMRAVDLERLEEQVPGYVEKVIRERLDGSFKAATSTGLDSVDAAILGWTPKSLNIFAAPPGWGKSALLRMAAYHAVAHEGKKLLYISTEQTTEEITMYLLCALARINTQDMRLRKRLTDGDVGRLQKARDDVQTHITAGHFLMRRMQYPTMTQIRALVERVEPDLVFIDYAHITKIAPPLNFRGDQNSHAIHIWSELERLKEDTQLPVVVATQMNSGWDKRKNKRPSALDVYCGTTAFQAADMLGYIYHPAIGDPDNDLLDKNVAEIIFHKARTGEQMVKAEVYWYPEYTLFSNTRLQHHHSVDLSAL